MKSNEIIKIRLIRFTELIIKAMIAWIIFLMVSCEPELENDFEHFKIPKGKHSGILPKTQSLQSKTLSFEAKFDESAIYQTNTLENQHDINKLMGFADCNSHHHDNSARFGWRWLDERLEIHAYVYNNGSRNSEFVGTVDLNESHNYELHMNDDYYVFTLEGNEPIFMSRTNGCNRGLYYMLFPYFGGNETAPHDITIQIKQHSF